MHFRAIESACSSTLWSYRSGPKVIPTLKTMGTISNSAHILEGSTGLSSENRFSVMPTPKNLLADIKPMI